MGKFNYERLFIFENENEAIEKSLVLLLIEISFKEITLYYAQQIKLFIFIEYLCITFTLKMRIVLWFLQGSNKAYKHTVVFTHTYTYFNIIFNLIYI